MVDASFLTPLGQVTLVVDPLAAGLTVPRKKTGLSVRDIVIHRLSIKYCLVDSKMFLVSTKQVIYKCFFIQGVPKN